MHVFDDNKIKESTLYGYHHFAFVISGGTSTDMLLSSLEVKQIANYNSIIITNYQQVNVIIKIRQ